MAKIFSAWSPGEFEQMMPHTHTNLAAEGENKPWAWLYAELANASSLQHRCVDILRRNGQKKQTISTSELSVPAYQADGVEELYHTASREHLYEPNHPSKHVHVVKQGLLCFVRLIFQPSHDCFSLLKLSVQLGGVFAIGWRSLAGPGARACPSKDWPYETLIDELNHKCVGAPWSRQRLQVALARLTMDEDSCFLLSIANDFPDLFQRHSTDSKAKKKELVALWNARTPENFITISRLDSIITKIRQVVSYWDALCILESGFLEKDHSRDYILHADTPKLAEQAPTHKAMSLLSGERLSRGQTKLQALALDWEVLEIVELLWEDRDLQDEIAIHQTKAWPHRQIAARLQAIHAASHWTAGRVEQAVRKLRASLGQFQKNNGLDTIDFEAFLVRIARGQTDFQGAQRAFPAAK
jgi:hypothetical protein